MPLVRTRDERLSWCHPHSSPVFFKAGDLISRCVPMQGYILSSANGARSGPAYSLLDRQMFSVGNSQVHSTSGLAPAHTLPGSLSLPGRVLVLVNVFVFSYSATIGRQTVRV